MLLLFLPLKHAMHLFCDGPPCAALVTAQAPSCSPWHTQRLSQHRVLCSVPPGVLSEPALRSCSSLTLHRWPCGTGAWAVALSCFCLFDTNPHFRPLYLYETSCLFLLHVPLLGISFSSTINIQTLLLAGDNRDKQGRK